MQLTLSPRFRRQWSRLPAPAQAQVAKALEKLHDGRGWRKGISSKPGVFELSVSGDLRLLWQYAGRGQIQVQAVVSPTGLCTSPRKPSSL